MSLGLPQFPIVLVVSLTVAGILTAPGFARNDDAKIKNMLSEGNLTELEALVAEDPEVLNRPIGQGLKLPPLHFALAFTPMEKLPGTLEGLIKAGADVNSILEEGEESLLHHAMRLNHRVAPTAGEICDVLALLVAAGAKPTALTGDDVPVIFWLLHPQGGRQASYSRKQSIKNAPFPQRDRRGVEILSWWVQQGLPLDTLGGDSETLLHIAARYHSLGVCQFLVDYGLDVQARDRLGQSPVFYAFKTVPPHQSTSQIVAYFLDLGVPIDVQDRYQRNLLHYSGKSVEATELLIARGTPVNHQDGHGNTPLIHAFLSVENARNTPTHESIDALLAAGADPKLVPKNGISALHYAVTSGRHRWVKRMLDAGADVNHLNTSESKYYLKGTPLTAALRPEFSFPKKNVIRLLLEHGAISTKGELAQKIREEVIKSSASSRDKRKLLHSMPYGFYEFQQGNPLFMDRYLNGIGNSNMPMKISKELAYRTLEGSPRYAAPKYIELLGHSDELIRQICLNRLLVYASSDQGYDFRNPTPKAIAAWEHWYKKHRNQLPGSWDLRQERAGVGIGYRRARNGFEIAQIFEGSGAAEAGIQVGDLLVAVNGFPATGKTYRDLSFELQGDKGSSVRLELVRHGQTFEFDLVRRFPAM